MSLLVVIGQVQAYRHRPMTKFYHFGGDDMPGLDR